jgi:WD40 repeat protein
LTLTGHRGLAPFLDFSPDNRWLATASWDGTIGLWDLSARPPTARMLRGHTSEVWDVAFSPDGGTLASSGSDNSIKLWNLASRQEAATLHGHSGPVSGIAFSPDGKHLASVGGWSLRIWDAPTFKEIDAAQNKVMR